MKKKWHIILDTSFFIGNNYFLGVKIRNLNNLVKNNLVSVYITDVILRELRKHLIEDLKKEMLTIKNVKLFSSIYKDEYNNSFDIKSCPIIANEQIEKWIKTNKVTVLSSNNTDIESILNLYFNQQLPFGPKKKKEFPDAIIYEVCKNYFSSGFSNVYMISRDNDFIKIKDKVINFIHSDNCGDLFSEILKHDETVNMIIIQIESIFFKKKSSFIKKIKDQINTAIKYEVENWFDEYDFTKSMDYPSVRISDFTKNEKFKVTYFDLESKTAELEYSVEYSVDIEYSGEEFGEVSYDIEGEIYYNGQVPKIDVNSDASVKVNFSIDNPLDDPVFSIRNLGPNKGLRYLNLPIL